MRALIEAKRKSKKTPRVSAGSDTGGSAKGENVVDLMAALKDSLKAEGGKGAKSSAKGKTAAAAKGKSGSSKKSA